MEAKNWEGTVMSREKLEDVSGNAAYRKNLPMMSAGQSYIKRIAQAQAKDTWEIAFKAGEGKGKQEGKQLAIKEVKGWLHLPCPHTGGLEEEQMCVEDCPKCWQAFLKERVR